MPILDGPLDTNGRVSVNLPTIGTQAGFARLASLRGSTSYFSEARITQDGELSVGLSTRIFEAAFNGANSGSLLNNQFNQQNTTLVTALNAGFLRFNNAAVTTINTGVSIHTWQTFVLTDHNLLKLSSPLKWSVGSAALSNKTYELGFGFYDVAAAQIAAMNEFIGFRFAPNGTLLACVDYSNGGVPTSIVQVLTAPSDNVTHMFEISATNEFAEFWIDNVCVAVIPMAADAPGLTKSNTFPVVCRLAIGAVAPATAPVFDLGDVTVTVVGPGGSTTDRAILQSMQGRDLHRAQAGIQSANGTTGVLPATGVSPTAQVANATTTPGATGTHGYARVTMTGVTATVHTELIMTSFQNPAIPETSGNATEARPFVVTEIMISPMIASVLFAGGGFTGEWFIAHGSTGISLAQADTVGAAAVGTKSPMKRPLPIFDTLPATAAAGTIATRTGEQGYIPLASPIVVNPGEFFQLGFRTMFVTAVVTAGAVDFGWDIGGYYL